MYAVSKPAPMQGMGIAESRAAKEIVNAGARVRTCGTRFSFRLTGRWGLDMNIR